MLTKEFDENRRLSSGNRTACSSPRRIEHGRIYIKQARTPTLIQHGATDQRVPLPNAYELYQGMQDQNVPVKLIVIRTSAASVTGRRSRRATERR